MPESECPACGGSRLSPRTAFRTSSSNTSILVYKDPNGRRLSPDPMFDAKEASACRDCGYVLVFLSEASRADLDERVDGYEPS
ncbi:MAG: hypothetical protein MUP67_01020 [Acidimicrobiia bacterium]|nr:hypothetical protein [Acidimicrobiia bacterium]